MAAYSHKSSTMALSLIQRDLLALDPQLLPVFESVGPRPRFYKQSDIYFGLMGAITAQQLSGKAADTIFGRFLDLCPNRYPHPKAVLTLTTEQLRGAGLSGQKAGYIQNIARFSLEKGMSDKVLKPMSDEEVINYLTEIKGVGRWTVEMILMFGLRRPDVFPVDDLGIQQAMMKLYRLRSRGAALRKNMLKRAEKWRPHRTYVSCCLWKWKD